MKKIIVLVVTISLSLISLYSADDQMLFKKANSLYQQNKFIDAINIYENMIHSGITNPELYYNLGNCFYKTENYTNAILWYERALILSPNNEDIQHNLKLSNAQIVDKIAPLPEVFYKRWYNGLHSSNSSSGWAWYSIIFIWLTAIALVIFIISKSYNLKRISFLLGVIFLFSTLITVFFAYSKKTIESTQNYGIIYQPSVYVKSSPDTESKNLFILHSGTKVEILDGVGNWRQIRILDGNKGWVEKNTFTKI